MEVAGKTWKNLEALKDFDERFGFERHLNCQRMLPGILNPILRFRVFDAGGIGGFSTNAFWGNEFL